MKLSVRRRQTIRTVPVKSTALVCLLLLYGCSRRNVEERALTPENSLKAIQINGDFHVELFAAEPEVMSPVDLTFDESGKIYVAEMLDYPEDPAPGKAARSRIRLLEDTNGDGKIDRSTIFADNVLGVSGIMPWKGGLIVTSAPDILFLKDTNGDGKADLRKVLYTGFPVVRQEARVTNPRLSVDNWIYCSNTGENGHITSPDHPEMAPVLVRGTDFRFNPVTGEAESASGPAQFGSTFDDFGNRFITENTTHIRHVVLPMKYLSRVPLLQISGESQDISDHGRPSARMFPLTHPQEWRKERSELRQGRYNENDLHVTEQVGGWFTAASGGTIYNGDAWPKEYVGDVFTGDVSGNLVHRDILFPEGPTFRAHRAKENVEFLASTDSWFRPCNFANAPDGNLYLTDIYRQVIEQPESIPEEIRKNINFFNGDTLGRVYRIVPNHPLRRGDLNPHLGSLSSADLVKQLANPNGWHRWTAHRMLLERQDPSAIPELQTMAVHGPSPESRVHSLWLLNAYSALSPESIQNALKDSDPRVKTNALELAEPFLGKSKSLADAALTAAADPDSHVQFQSALTLGDLKSPKSLSALAQLAHNRSSDEWFRAAVLSSVGNSASAFYRTLVEKGASWADPQMLIELSALIGAAHKSGELSEWFAVLPRLDHSELELEGLTRGLALARARNLQAPGAEEVLTRLTASNNGPVEKAAWATAEYFDFPALMGRAAKNAVEPHLPSAIRVTAIHALRGGHFSSVSPILDRILQQLPMPDVEVAVIDSLASFSDPTAGQIILTHWGTLTHDAREHALEALASHKSRVPLLLNAVASGNIKPSALDASVRSHLYENSDPNVVRRSRALLASTNSDRAQVVVNYSGALSMQGNVENGSILFAANCGRCHMPQLKGARVGPDLSGINNKTKEELLTDILNPSYAIEPRFINYVLTTNDGFTYDGVISNETPGAVTLRSGSRDRDHTVLRNNIADIRASSVSLMPEGFEQTLKKKDVADIIAYLRGGL